MTLWPVWILLAIVSPPSLDGGRDDPITTDQFLRLLRAQLEPFQDVAFAYEGEDRFVGEGESRPPSAFQGRYAIRSDGSTFWEQIVEDSRAGMEQHQVQAALKGKGEFALVLPGPGGGSIPLVEKRAAGPGAYFRPNSPEAYLFYYRFLSLLSGKPFDFKFIVWEEVDGHRCARVQFNPHPGAKVQVTQELWLDLERGCHPLKVSNRTAEATVFVMDQIKLKECVLGSGETIWFPIHGRFQGHHHGGHYTKEPSFEITYDVLDGTLVFNQGLKDEVFHAKGGAFRPSFRPRNPAVVQRPKRTTPDDFEAAEKALDAALADPARTAREPDASGSARQEFGTPRSLVWGLGFGGVAALTLAGWLAWRSRRVP